MLTHCLGCSRSVTGLEVLLAGVMSRAASIFDFQPLDDVPVAVVLPLGQSGISSPLQSEWRFWDVPIALQSGTSSPLQAGTRIKARSCLFPSTRHQTFNQYKHKEFSKKSFKSFQQGRSLQNKIISWPMPNSPR